MKHNHNTGNKSIRPFWRGMTTVMAGLLTFSMSAAPVIEVYRTDIDKFLGTKSTQIVTDNAEDKDLYTYKSDYSSTKELLSSIQDLGERMSEEGTVLLKNNGSLPLSKEETKKVTLLGFSSYFPVMGGDMGSSLTENKGTDADTVDMVQAFQAKGYQLNPSVKTMYDGLREKFKSSVVLPWASIDFYRTTSPSMTGYFTSLEPSGELLDSTYADWKETLKDYNVMIVTLARSGGENRNYMPGAAGVDPSQQLNQKDPLGLSDTERNIINTAIAAKKENNGKVIVMLNNASPMEIEEIKNNEGVDAILEIGLPGGYGFYGIADILSGEESPSGHLADTYAVVNANSPAAQNYGDYQYTNANQEKYINSTLVEAEGIYTGYKYYETRYADTVLNQGNASDPVGSSSEGNWTYGSEVSYPFGYGLSYTTFSQSLDSLNVDLDSRTVTAEVTVTNTGDTAGRDAVQLYVSLPYTEYDKNHLVEKSAIQLIDYGKTEKLEPGASKTVTLTADLQNMASWDSSVDNAVGTKGSYILDDGTYYFTLGNGSHEAVNNVLAAQGKTKASGMTEDGDASKVISWNSDQFDSTTLAYSKNGTAVENQLADMDLNYYMADTVTYLSRSDWKATWPKTYENFTATDDMLAILDNDTYEIKAQGNPSDVKFGEKNGLKLPDLKGVTDLADPRWEMLMNQITLEECMIRTGFGGTSTKPIESITSPEAVQNDGPNGFYSYTLGQYANKDKTSKDPYAVDETDPNLNYKFGTMANETVIAQTFNKDLAGEFGKAAGNYSIWSNCTIFWGAGVNLHRLPYNARNHEYYSEDPIITAGQASAMVAEGKKYGVIIGPKHFAFNDTEINRSGISVFMTEQKARETELRGIQSAIEDEGALGIMTAYNRVGLYTDNSHYGLLMNILRGEWDYKGLVSEDFIQDPQYAALKEAVYCGVTMTCNTGDNTMEAVSAKWPYWTVENVSKDAVMLKALKNAMIWQNYALANSNAMDGLSSSSHIVAVKTWYDYAITAAQIILALLTLFCAALYIKKSKKEV